MELQRMSDIFTRKYYTTKDMPAFYKSVKKYNHTNMVYSISHRENKVRVFESIFDLKAELSPIALHSLAKFGLAFYNGKEYQTFLTYFSNLKES